jgi:MFS family permease
MYRNANPECKVKSLSTSSGNTNRLELQIAAGTGVSMALPVMARELHMSSDKIPWVVSAFSLSSGCLLLLFGRLADLYGRKLVWQIGAVWMIAANVGCSLARTSVQLIVLRAMAGIGPAAMLPAALGILAHSFPPSRARSTAFATFSAGAPIGAALGMVFGGVLTEFASYVPSSILQQRS